MLNYPMQYYKIISDPKTSTLIGPLKVIDQNEDTHGWNLDKAAGSQVILQ